MTKAPDPHPPTRLFAVSPPGLEALVADELRAQGFARPRVVAGGVEWDGSAEDMRRANLVLRTPSRLLLRAGTFEARAFGPLFQRAVRLPWDRWLAAGDRVRFRVTCRRSRLYHTGAVAERLAAAVARRAPGVRLAEARGSEGSDERPDEADTQLVVVRVTQDRVSLSIDTSGDHLSRRGYRLETAKAPLRENLAAALLRFAGWRGEGVLLDPFCGAGTIAIEAAELALGLVAGRDRGFRFERWPAHDAAAWAEERARALALTRPLGGLVLASDRVQGALDATHGNAERAGVQGVLETARADFFERPPGERAGWLVANLPYGERIGRAAEMGRFYRRVAAHLTSSYADWRRAGLVPARVDPAALGLCARRAPILKTDHGGIPVSLWCAMP